MISTERFACQVLLVDDDEDDYILTRDMLSQVEGKKFRLHWAESYTAARQVLATKTFDVILVDYDLGQYNGISLIEEMVASGISTPMIMVTGRGSYEKDVEAMQAGAMDYINKNELSWPLLERTIRYAMERKHTENLLRDAKEGLEKRVAERVSELQEMNARLRVMEDELRERNLQLAEAMEVVEAEHRRYQSLFQYAPAGFLSIDGQGIILEANRRAAALLNVKPTALPGKPAAQFIDPADAAGFQDSLARLVAERQAQEVEVRLYPHEQPPFAAHLSGEWIEEPANEPVYTLWVIQVHQG